MRQPQPAKSTPAGAVLQDGSLHAKSRRAGTSSGPGLPGIPCSACILDEVAPHATHA